MKNLILFLTLAFFLGFTISKAQETKSIQGKLVINKYYKTVSQPKYNIDSVSIKNDTLTLFIKYLGGCKTPVFNLVTNGGVTYISPPMMILYLEQVEINEHCKKITNIVLHIPILTIRKINTSTLKLNIDNRSYILY